MCVSQRILLFAVCGLSCVADVRAASYMVHSAQEIRQAMSTASPGDALIMADGVWTDQHIDFEGFGQADNPITLRAETPGAVILTGSSDLQISGRHLVVDGLRFEDGRPSGSHIVRFTGSYGDARDSRLTNTQIVNYNPEDIDTRYFWVSLYGQNNRVDHNQFKGQNHSGVTVVAWLDDDTAGHQIDHNHFMDRPEGNANGFETIRIGTSDTSEASAGVVVENNLFERVDGEIEIISNKSNDNIYRFNTFSQSKGTLTLRHGHRATVEGNFFLGGDREGSGGVRVIGEDHVIANNYFADLDERAGGVISVTAGVPDTELSGYQQVRNALLLHNTIVHPNMPAIRLDAGLGSSGRTLLPEGVTVAGNIFLSDGMQIFHGQEGPGWTWEDNLAFGGDLGMPARVGVTVTDPMLAVADDGLWRPSVGSPAIDAIHQPAYEVLVDMDGQARVGALDIGADEVSSLQIVRVPLTAEDVGPGWIGGGSDPMEITPDGHAFRFQAEDFSRVEDPNRDGDTWQVVSSEAAFGQKALAAPAGSWTNLSSGVHDGLVVYSIRFDKQGSYTAYYRAKGPSTSTDSFYHPDELDRDPSGVVNTTSSDAWRWEVGETFTIAESHLDTPLELRLGKREQQAQLDAIVLHPVSDLSQQELDALFVEPALPGDFNGSGALDLRDLLFFETAVGSSDARYDLNGDGVVSARDGMMWLTALFGTLRSDMNLDGRVDLLDLSLLASGFGDRGGFAEGDLDFSGFVDLLDLSVLATEFNQTAGGLGVPEPSFAVYWLVLLVKSMR